MTKETIRQACHVALAKEQYTALADGTTFCNFGVHDILAQLGAPKFCLTDDGARWLMANEIIEKCEATGLRKLNCTEAFDEAKMGTLILAGMRMPEHGHVAVVYPFPAAYFSGKWSRSVPCVANIGKENGVMPVNWAFGAMPIFYKIL